MSVLSHMSTPDNSAVVRRLLARSRNNSGLFGLGDYPADLPNRILLTKGDAEVGPISSPVVPGKDSGAPEDILSILKQIRDLLSRGPEMYADEYRTRFVVQPREAISFIAPGGSTTIAAGAAVAVVSQQIDENFTGYLTGVGVNVDPPGSFPSITWQVRVNGAIHPKFSDRIFNANTLATPLPFTLELTQNRLVQLVAINGAGAPIDVSGIMVGWTEYMSAYKRYGSSPQSGIG